jgi:hypothetical protein
MPRGFPTHSLETSVKPTPAAYMKIPTRGRETHRAWSPFYLVWIYSVFSFCYDNRQVVGNKMELPFRQLPVIAPLEHLNSSSDRLDSAEASVRARPISAQKALPGIEVLHVTWKKCNTSVACNSS